MSSGVYCESRLDRARVSVPLCTVPSFFAFHCYLRREAGRLTYLINVPSLLQDPDTGPEA